MKKVPIIFFSLIGITTFNSCEKITDTTWLYYDETYCADPWGQDTVPEKDKKKNVEEHLKGKGIKVFKVEILSYGTIIEPCNACHCKSGKRIRCKIKENHLEKAINEGFYK